MKFLITEPDSFSEDSQKKLGEFGEVKVIEASMAQLMRFIKDVDVLLVGLELFIGKEVLNDAKQLKIIGSPTTGLDHIDLELAKERGIKVISLKGDLEFTKEVDASFEHTVALLLSLIRKIPYAFDSVKEYSWERKRFIGNELKYKTLGILGYGRLGKKVANLCSHFKMKIIVNDLIEDKIKDDGFEAVTKKELFEKSDIVSIHVPLQDSTLNLVNKEDLELLKPGSWLINTSRGSIVNEDSLLEALKSEKLAGAALDVLSTENTPSHPHSNKLIEYARTHDNLLITPHIAGSTFESLKMTGLHITEEVINFIKQHIIKNKNN